MAEVNNVGGNSTIVNYGVSSREGKIYRSSKIEEDGYTKIEMQNGGITYHKYLDGLSGKVTYMARDQKEFVQDGKTKKLDNLKVFLNDGTTTQAISLATYSQEWKLFIKHMFNVDFNKDITLAFYKKKVEDKSYLNCMVKYTGETTEDGKAVYPKWLDAISVSKGGDVPDATKNKKGEWDYTDNDIWFLEKMEVLIQVFNEFKAKNGGNTPAPQAPSQTQAEEPKAEVAGAGLTKNDSLPF